MAVKVTKAMIAAARHVPYEEIFDQFGITHELRLVERLDIERHEESQARLQAANPTRVNRYLAQYKAGSVPPPVTVYEDGFVGLRLIDANHRVKMYEKARVTELWAYVLTGTTSGDPITETQARWLGAALNGIHGLPLSTGEIELAVNTGLELGYKPEQIAYTVGANVSKVNRVIRINRFNERATKLGLVTDGIKDTLRDKFSSLPDDSVFEAAVKLQRDAEMTTDEWDTKDIGLLALIRAASSEPERLRVLTVARTDREAAIKTVKRGATPTPSPVLDCQKAILGFERAMKLHPHATSWVPTGSTAEEWVDRISGVRDFLNGVLATADMILGVDPDDSDDATAGTSE
jgi:hypothetical protein